MKIKKGRAFQSLIAWELGNHKKNGNLIGTSCVFTKEFNGEEIEPRVFKKSALTCMCMFVPVTQSISLVEIKLVVFRLRLFVELS